MKVHSRLVKKMIFLGIFAVSFFVFGLIKYQYFPQDDEDDDEKEQNYKYYPSESIDVACARLRPIVKPLPLLPLIPIDQEEPEPVKVPQSIDYPTPEEIEATMTLTRQDGEMTDTGKLESSTACTDIGQENSILTLRKRPRIESE